jgi:hypothetical protein
MLGLSEPRRQRTKLARILAPGASDPDRPAGAPAARVDEWPLSGGHSAWLEPIEDRRQRREPPGGAYEFVWRAVINHPRIDAGEGTTPAGRTKFVWRAVIPHGWNHPRIDASEGTPDGAYEFVWRAVIPHGWNQSRIDAGERRLWRGVRLRRAGGPVREAGTTCCARPEGSDPDSNRPRPWQAAVGPEVGWKRPRRFRKIDQ